MPLLTKNWEKAKRRGENDVMPPRITSLKTDIDDGMLKAQSVAVYCELERLLIEHTKDMVSELKRSGKVPNKDQMDAFKAYCDALKIFKAE